MSREHHKDHKSKRLRDPHDAHRSHKHKSHKAHKLPKSPKTHKTHKSHKSQKSPKIHKSKRNSIAEPPPELPTREEVPLFNRLEERLLAAMVLESARKQKQTAKVHYAEPSPEPSPKPAKISKVKTPVKTLRTVSIAGVFRRANHQPPAKKEKKIKKIPDPDPELVIELQEQFETAYINLQTEAKDSFNTIRAQFTKRIEKTRADDVEMINSVTAAHQALSAPLVNEKVEIVINNDGNRERHTVTLGKRVDSFKSFIATEKANLKDLWSQWNSIQDEYRQLGVEVFGFEALGDSPAGEIHRDVNGYKKEMEELDLQHNSAVEELDEEIEELRMKSMMRLKSAEKELDKAAKADQETFFRTLLFD